MAKVRKILTSMAAALAISLGMLGIPAGAVAGETSVYIKSGWYNWRENLNGSSFVKESGLMHGVGAARKDSFEPVTLREKLEIWGGNLDYDGHDITGTVPLKSDTSYLGTREEVAVSLPLAAGEGVTVEPFAGLGHKFWIRTRSSEDWNTFYSKVGLGGEVVARDLRIFAKGGALIPIYTRTRVTLSDAGYQDVVTEPRSQPSAFVEGGVKVGSFVLSVEFEGMNFGESSRVATHSLSAGQGAAVVNGFAFQPKAHSDFVSFKLAYQF
ncbi:hypothetical protein GMSM_34370 [Geomonas sp. Red276]